MRPSPQECGAVGRGGPREGRSSGGAVAEGNAAEGAGPGPHLGSGGMGGLQTLWYEL